MKGDSSPGSQCSCSTSAGSGTNSPWASLPCAQNCNTRRSPRRSGNCTSPGAPCSSGPIQKASPSFEPPSNERANVLCGQRTRNHSRTRVALQPAAAGLTRLSCIGVAVCHSCAVGTGERSLAVCALALALRLAPAAPADDAALGGAAPAVNADESRPTPRTSVAAPRDSKVRFIVFSGKQPAPRDQRPRAGWYSPCDRYCC